MSIADIKKNAEAKMEQSINAFKNNLSKIRTGRANPQLLDTIMVEYYGSPVPLSQVANVALLDSRTISVQPWEKGMGAKIEKAIRESDLGLNPASMGDLIRVPMPPMSEERRKEMTKLVKAEGENAKIAVRNLRRDANESVKKIGQGQRGHRGRSKAYRGRCPENDRQAHCRDRPAGRLQRARHHGRLMATFALMHNHHLQAALCGLFTGAQAC